MSRNYYLNIKLFLNLENYYQKLNKIKLKLFNS